MSNHFPKYDDAAPQDTLSVYLALEKRVKALEDELSFTKLNINALYLKIKDLKAAQESISAPELSSKEYTPGDPIIDYLKTNVTPKLDELMRGQEQLLRGLGGLGKAD